MSGDSAQEDSNSVTAARSRLTKLNGRFILKSFALCRFVSSRGVFLNPKSEVSAADPAALQGNTGIQAKQNKTIGQELKLESTTRGSRSGSPLSTSDFLLSIAHRVWPALANSRRFGLAVAQAAPW